MAKADDEESLASERFFDCGLPFSFAQGKPASAQNDKGEAERLVSVHLGMTNGEVFVRARLKPCRVASQTKPASAAGGRFENLRA